jgi:AcrR family transcriptional regulator
MKAAVDCFAEQGYTTTSVDEICRRAGVSKGAFYHHFTSKQEFFQELQNSWLAELDTQMDAIRWGAATVPEGLLNMAEMLRVVFQVADGQLPLFLEFWNQARQDPNIWQATLEPFGRYRTFFSRIIQDGIAEGTLRPVDPDTAAQALVSLAVGLLLQRLLDPEGADWGQVAQDSIQIVLDGFKSDQVQNQN